jgi:hypothetical protein
MAMCFALRDYTSNMKVCMVVFQLKGSALLWWKMLLPHLNMVVEDVSWELFEERFQERYLSEEFIERQLNEFNALRQGGRMVPEYEAHFWSCFGMLCTKLPRNLRGLEHLDQSDPLPWEIWARPIGFMQW